MSIWTKIIFTIQKPFYSFNKNSIYMALRLSQKLHEKYLLVSRVCTGNLIHGLSQGKSDRLWYIATRPGLGQAKDFLA
jgi:hypothetical protein